MGQSRIAGRIGNMSLGKQIKQSGFTLIEALIAFVVLTVGILGALLFHSTLIKESGVSKAQVEALKIAERTIEEQRGDAVYPTAGAFYDALSTAANSTLPDIVGSNDTYSLNWGTPTAVSGSSDVYLQNLTVSWSQGSIDLATYFSWIDPNKTIAADEADSGDGGGYSGDIPIPTGTLSAIAREEIELVSEAERDAFDQGSDIRPGIKKYEYDGDNIVAVDVGDGNYVKLVKLSDPDNEIMTISGKIINSWDDNHPSRRVALKFDEVFKQPDDTYKDEIIDVRATGGANCVIGDFDNFNASTGNYATYLCVAGTGWNGTIYPYFRTIDGTTLKEIDLQEVQGVDAIVCAPRQRSYRYYIVTVNEVSGASPSNLERLNDIISGASVGVTSSAEAILTSVNASVDGQSGLVRFYETASEASSSSEGVVWDSYFWHNPDFIINPTESIAASVAAGGYAVPPFASNSDQLVNYPGDVAYQNFYLAVPTVGSGNTAVTWDCDDVITEAISTFASAASASRLDHNYQLAKGMPGYSSSPSTVASGSQLGYVPSSASASNYSVNDYNLYEWVSAAQGNNVIYTGAFRGSFVLGYTLATKSISGYLVYPSTLDGSSFRLAGNPEPVVSISCNLSDINESEASAYRKYAYTCGIPANWSGNILAYAQVAGNQEACDVGDVSIGFAELNSEPVSIATLVEGDLASADVEAYPAVSYFANNVVSAAGSAELFNSDLKRLSVNIYSGAVNDSLENQNFYFTDLSAPNCLEAQGI